MLWQYVVLPLPSVWIMTFFSKAGSDGSALFLYYRSLVGNRLGSSHVADELLDCAQSNQRLPYGWRKWWWVLCLRELIAAVARTPVYTVKLRSGDVSCARSRSRVRCRGRQCESTLWFGWPDVRFNSGIAKCQQHNFYRGLRSAKPSRFSQLMPAANRCMHVPSAGTADDRRHTLPLLPVKHRSALTSFSE